MSLPFKPASPGPVSVPVRVPVEDDAPPLPGEVWMESIEDLEELDDDDDEITNPGVPIGGRRTDTTGSDDSDGSNDFSDEEDTTF
jgi:hypothetical protein